MEKLVYMLSHGDPFSGADLRNTLLSDVVPMLRHSGASQVSLNLADEDVEQGRGVTIRNASSPIRGMLSFWMDNSDDRDPCEQAIAQTVESLAGYLVVESRPLIHSPPIGSRTPGANLVTCINRKPGLSDEIFFDLWNREHRKVALEIQSTFSYVRNAVVRKLTHGAPDRDGIVEEGFPIEALTDPLAWYDCDSAEEHQRRVKAMLASVIAFLDLSVMDSTPMSEYCLG